MNGTFMKQTKKNSHDITNWFWALWMVYGKNTYWMNINIALDIMVIKYTKPALLLVDLDDIFHDLMP